MRVAESSRALRQSAARAGPDRAWPAIRSGRRDVRRAARLTHAAPRPARVVEGASDGGRLAIRVPMDARRRRACAFGRHYESARGGRAADVSRQRRRHRRRGSPAGRRFVRSDRAGAAPSCVGRARGLRRSSRISRRCRPAARVRAQRRAAAGGLDQPFRSHVLARGAGERSGRAAPPEQHSAGRAQTSCQSAASGHAADSAARAAPDAVARGSQGEAGPGSRCGRAALRRNGIQVRAGRRNRLPRSRAAGDDGARTRRAVDSRAAGHGRMGGCPRAHARPRRAARPAGGSGAVVRGRGCVPGFLSVHVADGGPRGRGVRASVSRVLSVRRRRPGPLARGAGAR